MRRRGGGGRFESRGRRSEVGVDLVIWYLIKWAAMRKVICCSGYWVGGVAGCWPLKKNEIDPTEYGEATAEQEQPSVQDHSALLSPP